MDNFRMGLRSQLTKIEKKKKRERKKYAKEKKKQKEKEGVSR